MSVTPDTQVVVKPFSDDKEIGIEEIDIDGFSDIVYDTLYKQSKTDLDQWLKSPFWTVCVLMLKEELEACKRDLLDGGIVDIAKRARAEGYTGALHDSDASLRGAILAINEMLNFPDKLYTELEIANNINKEEGE